jgi:hypothetical protein
MADVTFNYGANVESSSDPPIQAGDTLEGVVSYDDTLVGHSGAYNFKGSYKTHTFNLTDYRGKTQITVDSYAGAATSPYTITISSNGGSFTLVGLTAAGRTFRLVITTDSPSGNDALPTSMATWNTGTGMAYFT